MCAVVDMQDFDGLILDPVHDDVKQRGEDKFSGTASSPGTATIRRGLQGADTLINPEDGRLCELRMVPLQVVFDVF